MLNRHGAKPLYTQIKEHLLEQIAAMAHHSRIPSEPELAATFRVSRGTVKQAIDELAAEGRVYRVPKRGTFVSPPRIYRSFGKLPSYSEDIRARGLTPGVHLVDLSLVVATDKVRADLNLTTGAKVWMVKRVRTADGDPIALSTSYLPMTLVPELTEEQVSDSLYATLDRVYDIRPVRAHDTYTAWNADPVAASLLSVSTGTALILSERISYLADDRPVEYALSYIRGDRFEIHVDIGGNDSPGIKTIA